MTAGRLIFPGLMPVENADGDRIDGAKAYFYTDGTTTLANTYTDSGLSVLATNPVVADGVGVWPAMWADTATLFTVSITDSDGAPVPAATWSGVSAAIDATLASADLAASAQSAAEVAQAAAETAQAAAEAAEVQAQAYAAAISGEPFSGTSTTNLSIGSGTKIWVMDQEDLLLHEGQTIVGAVEDPLASNQMTGVIQSYNTVTKQLTVLIASHAEPDGVGPYASWRISLSATAGVASTRTITAAGLVTGGGNLSADRTVTVTAAVAADVRTGTSTTTAVTPAALVSAAAFVALTDAATVAWDVNDGFNAKVTLAGNRTIGAPTNVQDGITYTLDISQDATGSRVPSWNAIWDWGASGAPTLSTAANKKDKVIAQYSAASAKLEASFRRSA